MSDKAKKTIGLILNSVMAVYTLVICILGSFPNIDVHWAFYAGAAVLMLIAFAYDGIVIAPKYKETFWNTDAKEDSIVNENKENEEEK